jgi:hypothetical protein
MKLMTYAITRAGENQTISRGYGLQVSMVIGVFEVCLQRIMVNITNAQLGSYPWYAYGFEL